MFVGEQPGDQEDRSGRPFVGPVGQLRDPALAAAGIGRGNVYVTSAVKHFKWEPRGKRRLNKKPVDAEIAACHQWLERALKLDASVLVVALGQTAARALLHAAAGLMPTDTTLNVATIHGILLYDDDLDARDGIPQPVAALKERIDAADGLLLAKPEYNNGITGALKNTIDGLSRPQADIQRVFRDRPAAVIGASPAGFGTILVQNA